MNSDLLVLAWCQLWQVTLLIGVVAILVRVLGRNRPHVVYALWLVVLVKCVTPPLFTSASGVFCWLQPVEQAAVTMPGTPLGATLMADVPYESDELIIPLYPVESLPVEPAETVATVRPSPVRFSTTHLAVVGVLVWLLGAAVSLGLSLWQWLACLRTARRSRREADAKLVRFVQDLAGRLGLRRAVSVIVTQGRLGPAVTGVFRAKLLMPEGMLVDKTPAELEPILAHELLHIRRGDLWAGLLQTVVLALWWFHPLVRWAVRESMREAERCCDEAVLAELGCRPRDYARSLLVVLQYKTEWAPAPVFPGAGRVDATAKRLERIMGLGQGCRRRSPWWCWVVMIGVAAVVLPGGAFVVSGEKETAAASDAPAVTPKTADSRQLTIDAASIVFEPAATLGVEEADRYWVTYEAADVLDKIEQADESRDEAKSELMELCGIEGDRQGPHASESRIVWKDDTLIAIATRAEHNTIRAELEAIREHGLCSLEIEVLCVQGPAAEIEAMVESEGPGAELLKEKEDWEATVGQLTCRSLVVRSDLKQVMLQSKANPAVRVLASPRLRVRTGQTATVRIQEALPDGPNTISESAAAEHVPFKLEMQFQPRLRAGNKVLLQSDVTLSEAEREEWRTHSQSKWRMSGIRVFSRKASSTALGALGDTVAIRTEGPVDGSEDSEQALVFVRVVKSEASLPPVKAEPESLRAWIPLGLELETIDEEVFEREFNTRYRGGLRVTNVRTDSPAAEGGMRAGDVLVGLHIWETMSLKNVYYVLSRADLEEFLPLKFYVLRDGDILYGHLPVTEKPATGEVSRGESPIYIQTYNVADMVVPMIDEHQIPPDSAEHGTLSSEDFDSLIELITVTIAPDTWEDVGGPGTIAPFAKNRSLVIRQSEEVHEEIIELLEKIRRQQRQQAVLNVRAVQVPSGLGEEFWREVAEGPAPAVMSAARTKQLLRRLSPNENGILVPKSNDVQQAAFHVDEDGFIEANPSGVRLTVLNGQAPEMPVTKLTPSADAEARLQLQAVIGGNIRLAAVATSKGQKRVDLQVVMNSGETVVFEITNLTKTADDEARTFVLVTPTVVLQDEEELVR